MQRISRRLALLGILAGGSTTIGIGWRITSQSAFSSSLGLEYFPWQIWKFEERQRLHRIYSKYGTLRELSAEKQLAERIEDIARAGMLAPSFLNTQPWKFRLSHDRVELFADLDRWVRPLDPLQRELLLTLGGALENMIVAAAARGFSQTVAEAWPVEPGEPVASISLAPVSMRDVPEYEFIPKTRANWGPYDDALEVSEGVRDLAKQTEKFARLSVVFIKDPQKMRDFRVLTVGSLTRMLENEQLLGSIYRWYRHRRDVIHLRRDGLVIDGFGLSLLDKFVLKFLPKMEPAEFSEFFVDLTNTQLAHSSMFTAGCCIGEQN